MRALFLALAVFAPAFSAHAEAVWCNGAAPPPDVPLIEGRRVSVPPGVEAPACLNVPLPAYRKPFPVFCAAKPQATAGAWCDSASGRCGPLPVQILRHDKGRLATAQDVRYCASFVNRGKVPVVIWLARPGAAKTGAAK